jgi:ATP-binding cassette subfamily B protein
MQKPPKTVANFLTHILKPYKTSAALLIMCGIIWGIQNALEPYMLKLIVDGASEYSGDKTGIFNTIKMPIIFYLLLILANALNYRVKDLVVRYLFPNLRADTIRIMFSYLQRHSLSYFQKNLAGKIANQISEISNSVGYIFARIEEAIAVFARLLIAIAAVFLVHPIFSLILCIGTVAFILVTVYCSTKIHRVSVVLSESKMTLVGRVVDTISNIMNVILFSRFKYEEDLLEKSIRDTVVKDRKMQLTILILRAVQDLLILTLVATSVFALAILYQRNLVTIGDFIFILSVSTSIYSQIWDVANHITEFSQELGKCSQALTILNVEHDIIDKPDATNLVVRQGTIEFRDVKFKYDESDQIFKNHNVTIKAGERVGLVGFSGSGKTTFVRLILRLFEVKSGAILIDGQDIKTVTQDSLHANIAIIPQDVVLFHRTILENIGYGKSHATKKEILDAAKRAYCDEFVKALPDKYETIVGERGFKLSGGQRQRIAIARAILSKAPILILDEATSALDSLTEKYIHKSLDKLMEGRTTIAIAHRLSTLGKMDRIIVFDHDGRIVEDGPHNVLIKRNKLYAKMWKMQTSGFLPDT